MGDHNFEILIKYIQDPTQARAAAQELDKIKQAGTEATKELAEGTDKATLKTKDLRKSIGLIGAEFGPVGRLAGFLFSSVATGAASAAFIIKQMLDEMGRWNSAISSWAENSAKGIGNLRTAFQNLERDRLAANEAFKASSDAVESATKRQIDRIHEEKNALDELANAREKAELAGAKTEEERAAISKKYNAIRRATGERASAKEISAKESKIAALTQEMMGQGREGIRLSGGLSPQQVSAHLADMPNVRASLDEQIGEAQKNLEDLVPGFWMTLGLMVQGKAGADQMKTIMGSVQNSKATLKKLKQTRSFYDEGGGFEKNLRGAQLADANVRSLQKSIGLESESLADNRASLSNTRTTDIQLSGIESGRDAQTKLLLDAAAGADAIRGGGRATRQQAAAINEAQRGLGLANATPAQLISVLSRVNDSLENMQKALNQFENRLKVQARQQ